MDIKTAKEIAYADKPVLFESFEEKSLSPDTLKSLDEPITDKIKIRDTLEPLNDEQKQDLSDTGYSDSVIEAIGSKEEADIYTGANLECKEVNGNDALIRTDIDLDKKDDFGNTNLERMEKGKAPLDKEGKPIELHHIGQTADAPLAELTRSEHMGNGNDSILHDKAKESEIDRSEFKKEREEHWKARAEEIKQKLGIENE